MEKTKQKAVDKTKLLQSLEKELLESGNRYSGLNRELDIAISELATYFENQDTLIQGLNFGALTYEHAFLRRKAGDMWVQENVAALLSEFRQARDLDPDRFWNFWIKRIHVTESAIKNTAAVLTLMLQGDRSELDLYVFVKSIIRDAGDLLEGSLQPFARLRLEVWDILNWRSPSAPPIESMTFGEVISELSQNVSVGQIYKTLPFGISVSQWRNISNHNSFEVKGEHIICAYGPAGKRKTIELCMDDLASVLRYCDDLYYVHKIAREFFGIDNVSKILPYGPEYVMSDYSLDCSLAYGLVSAGFSIIEASYRPKDWVLRLKDRHARKHRELKTALQDACYSYLLFSNPVHFVANVHSGTHVYRISFLASIVKKGATLPPGFRGDVRGADKIGRIGKSCLMKVASRKT